VKRNAWIAALLAGSLLASACGKSDDSGSDDTDSGSSTGQAGSDDVVKVAWILPGPINDGGWSTAHNEGRLAVEEHFGDKVETTYKESVADGPQADQVVADLVKDGYDLIFGASFGFGESLIPASEANPDIAFEHATGIEPLDNMGIYFGAGEQSLYLTGMAAGAETTSNLIGFVAPFPIPEVIRHINAYTLGAQAMNPDAQVKVVWTNSWFDPETERKAAESLIADGADVIANGGDGPAPGEAAQAAGVAWTGYDADQSENFPDIWLTAALYHWGDYYIGQVQKLIDGTWEPGDYYGNIADGLTDIAPFGKRVSAETQAKIMEKRDEYIAGTFDETAGPIYDQDGELKIPEGEVMSHADQMSVMWFVKGVIGTIPSS